jgi:uncharacterized membrane protein
VADLIYRILRGVGFPHPLHPVLVHITTGSVAAAFIFGFVAWIFKKSNLYTTARHSVVLALISSFFTIFMGFMDSLLFFGGLSNPIITTKIILSGSLTVLLIVTVFLNMRVKAESKISLVLYTLSLIDVVALGIFGGNLVY